MTRFAGENEAELACIAGTVMQLSNTFCCRRKHQLSKCCPYLQISVAASHNLRTASFENAIGASGPPVVFPNCSPSRTLLPSALGQAF
jgi:hypothetical protein